MGEKEARGRLLFGRGKNQRAFYWMILRDLLWHQRGHEEKGSNACEAVRRKQASHMQADRQTDRYLGGRGRRAE
jgi:hypothetical protein